MMDSPPIVSQHISWISLDPVQGCPASCAYCYLAPKGLTRTAPQIIELAPETAYQKLKEYRYFSKSIFAYAPANWAPPIAIGNYTDMCMTPKNRDYLLKLLRVHERVLPEVPVCILTKAALDKSFLERVSEINATVIFLISLSFLPAEFEKGTPPTEARLKNFSALAEFPNLKRIHWWRPITSISIPDRAVVEQQIDLLQEAGSVVSVAIGLRYGQYLNEIFKDPHNPLSRYYVAHVGALSNELIFEPWIQEEILRVAEGKGYPVFTGTACAISFLLDKQCYKAGFRKAYSDQSCINSNCHVIQKEHCIRFAQEYPTPSSALLEEVAKYLGLPTEHVKYSSEHDAIVVKDILLQEEQNFLAQATSFPVIGELLVKNLEWTANSLTAPFTIQDRLEY